LTSNDGGYWKAYASDNEYSDNYKAYKAMDNDPISTAWCSKLNRGGYVGFYPTNRQDLYLTGFCWRGGTVAGDCIPNIGIKFDCTRNNNTTSDGGQATLYTQNGSMPTTNAEQFVAFRDKWNESNNYCSCWLYGFTNKDYLEFSDFYVYEGN
jgi:hypothetical protein